VSQSERSPPIEDAPAFFKEFHDFFVERPAKLKDLSMADTRLASTQDQFMRISENRDLRVLIVNDYRDNVESMAMLLRLYGYQVDTALGGAAALASARKQPPNVVLLDISMPGIDGFEVARQLRDLFHDNIIIVALTAYGSDEDRRRYELAGFDRHFTKPADPAEVEQLLHNLALSLAC
jgi:CheY-like chemotaxis protein